MSFGDMMSSGRGPGVIGIILALVVLAGFGLLFLFALDEDMQGGDQSLESIIAYQTKEIDNLKESIVPAEKQWRKGQSLLATRQQLEDLKRANQLQAGRREKLLQDITAANDAIAASTAQLAAYKQDYRKSVHSKAKGTKIARLETRKGRIYEDVLIREVTELGIEIRHEGGSARIPPEDLPAAMQAALLFDPQQQATDKARREAAEAAEAAASVAVNQQLEEEPATREQRILSIAKNEARIALLGAEIRELEQAIPREEFKATSQAPQMKARVNAKKNELEKIQAQVFRLRDRL